MLAIGELDCRITETLKIICEIRVICVKTTKDDR